MSDDTIHSFINPFVVIYFLIVYLSFTVYIFCLWVWPVWRFLCSDEKSDEISDANEATMLQLDTKVHNLKLLSLTVSENGCQKCLGTSTGFRELSFLDVFPNGCIKMDKE